MKTTAQDVFTAFYEAFHKLHNIEPINNEPESFKLLEKEVENTLKACSDLLEKYVDSRINKALKKKQEEDEYRTRVK